MLSLVICKTKIKPIDSILAGADLFHVGPWSGSVADDAVNSFHEIVEESLGFGQDFGDAKGAGAAGAVGGLHRSHHNHRHGRLFFGPPVERKDTPPLPCRATSVRNA